MSFNIEYVEEGRHNGRPGQFVGEPMRASEASKNQVTQVSAKLLPHYRSLISACLVDSQRHSVYGGFESASRERFSPTQFVPMSRLEATCGFA